MIEVRRGSQKLYKGHYFIVFYDIDDETLLYMFDNVREILKFMKRPITSQSIRLINVELYRALKTDSHITKFLTGKFLRVYVIDTK